VGARGAQQAPYHAGLHGMRREGNGKSKREEEGEKEEEATRR